MVYTIDILCKFRGHEAFKPFLFLTLAGIEAISEGEIPDTTELMMSSGKEYIALGKPSEILSLIKQDCKHRLGEVILFPRES